MHWSAAALALSMCGSLTGQSGLDPDERPPNLVIIMADDLGYRDLSCYGCIDFQTPHIDDLAAAGVRCTNGYVSHPYCSPSRAGLVSGRYQQRFGHEHNPPYREDDDQIGIDPATRLLPNIMRESGYVTGLIGKWHLGAGEPFRPVTRGFSEFYGFLGGGHDYFRVDPGGSEYTGPIWRDDAPTDDRLSYLTDDLTSEAEAFIDRHADDPFCLLLMYNAPHAPDQVTDAYRSMVEDIEHPQRKRYAALVRGVDEGVGRVRAKLGEKGLSERTLLVLLSDNGGRRSVADNRPLRGNKGWLHEGGVRVPFILARPGTLPAGATYEHPVIALDLLPTAMTAAGITLPADLDGLDLMPFLTGGNDRPPHETLYWRVSGGAGYALRRGNFKLVHDIAMNEPALYDLTSDPGEDHDLAHERPELVSQLLSQYERWAQELEPPRWTDGHTRNTTDERTSASEAGTRQYPMIWAK